MDIEKLITRDRKAIQELDIKFTNEDFINFKFKYNLTDTKLKAILNITDRELHKLYNKKKKIEGPIKQLVLLLYRYPQLIKELYEEIDFKRGGIK